MEPRWKREFGRTEKTLVTLLECLWEVAAPGQYSGLEGHGWTRRCGGGLQEAVPGPDRSQAWRLFVVSFVAQKGKGKGRHWGLRRQSRRSRDSRGVHGRCSSGKVVSNPCRGVPGVRREARCVRHPSSHVNGVRAGSAGKRGKGEKAMQCASGSFETPG